MSSSESNFNEKVVKKNYIFKKNYEMANEASASYGKDEVGPFTD